MLLQSEMLVDPATLMAFVGQAVQLRNGQAIESVEQEYWFAGQEVTQADTEAEPTALVLPESHAWQMPDAI